MDEMKNRNVDSVAEFEEMLAPISAREEDLIKRAMKTMRITRVEALWLLDRVRERRQAQQGS